MPTDQKITDILLLNITIKQGNRDLFIYLFIYDKEAESATDMPMTVNSKLTRYKIRQISTENNSDKLSRSYDDLYLGVTFWGHGILH